MFLCCQPCEEALKGDPDKYLAKLDAPAAAEAPLRHRPPKRQLLPQLSPLPQRTESLVRSSRFQSEFPMLARLVCLLIVCAATLVRAEEAPLSRIAFGACAKQDKPQPIWDAIIEAQPQQFVFLGDNIYGDTEDMALLKSKWDLLAAQPGYVKLKALCPVTGTWDDHDYGKDDAGVEYPKKVESQKLFLDFLGVPPMIPAVIAKGSMALR